MDLTKRYHDTLGCQYNVLEIVERDPEWAANRIQEGEKSIEELERLKTGIHMAMSKENNMVDTTMALGEIDAAVAEDVINELKQARSAHAPLNSAHEAYAVIKEELDEFWAEVMKKSKVRSKEKMAEELQQIAAMAIRAIVDLGLRYD